MEREIDSPLDQLGQIDARGRATPGWQAVAALSAARDVPLGPLLDALTDDRWRRRLHAVALLGARRVWPALPDLARALDDPRARVRRAAARALRDLGTPAHADADARRLRRRALRRTATRDRDRDARLAAAGALIRLGEAGDAEVTTLAEILDRADPEDTAQNQAATRALDLLGELGPAARGALEVVVLATLCDPTVPRAHTTLARIAPRLVIGWALQLYDTAVHGVVSDLPRDLHNDIAYAVQMRCLGLTTSASPPAAVTPIPRPPGLQTLTLEPDRYTAMLDALALPHEAVRGDVLPEALWRLARALRRDDPVRALTHLPDDGLTPAPGRRPILERLPRATVGLLAHLGQPEAVGTLGGTLLPDDRGPGFAHAPRLPLGRDAPIAPPFDDDDRARAFLDWVHALDGWGPPVRARALRALVDDVIPSWIRATYDDWGPARTLAAITRLIDTPTPDARRALAGVSTHPSQGCSPTAHAAAMVAHHATRFEEPDALRAAARSALTMWHGPTLPPGGYWHPRDYAVPLPQAIAHLQRLIARALIPWLLGRAGDASR